MSELKNPLPQEHFYNVCKPGQGHDCCRYVVAGAKGIECAKHTSLRDILDRRASAGEMVARADNCDGVKNQEF